MCTGKGDYPKNKTKQKKHSVCDQMYYNIYGIFLGGVNVALKNMGLNTG